MVTGYTRYSKTVVITAKTRARESRRPVTPILHRSREERGRKVKVKEAGIFKNVFEKIS